MSPWDVYRIANNLYATEVLRGHEAYLVNQQGINLAERAMEQYGNLSKVPAR